MSSGPDVVAHQTKLRTYLQGLIKREAKAEGNAPSEAMRNLASGTEESAFADEQERDAVRSAEAKLATGDALSHDEALALEAIILPDRRPVFDVLNDSFHEPVQPRWKNLHETTRRGHLETAIKAIGRVNLHGAARGPYSGTGFLIARDLLLTNRHVADDFSMGVGLEIEFTPGITSDIDLKQEVYPSPAILLTVDRVAMIHPHWDAALVQVSGFPQDRQPLALAGEPPQNLVGRTVAAIGYPAFDPRNDVNVQNRVFHGRYYVKRLQPGEVVSASSTVSSFQHSVEALAHDCSTLGGNSGSALVDVETGDVLGLHFAGTYLEANYAVPTWELARDPRVREFGIEWSSPPAAESQPASWLRAWEKLPTRTVSAPVPVPPAPTVTPSPAVAGPTAVNMPPGWYERIGDEELARMYLAHPTAVRAELVRLLGETETDDLINDLQEMVAMQQAVGGQEGLFDGEEGLFWTRPDPDLPEVVFLHGIMGGHLAHAGFFRNRMWMDPKEFLKGNLPEKMSLQRDGVSNAPGLNIEPDGHIRMKYAKAARKWRKARFVVHAFSYDWRRGVHHASDALHRFLERRALENPNASFVLVAHSMGGLVSSLYAHRHRSWQDRVERAIFLGSPLGGSYSVPVSITEQDSFIATLAKWSRRDNHREYARMAATFPGLIDMLPHPTLFPEAAPLYQTSGWPAGTAPNRRWLNQSLNLKPLLRDSPLLGRTTLFVSLHHGTVESMSLKDGKLVSQPATGRGDGTVPARSALVDGVPAYKVNKLHGDLALDPLVIDNVIQLIRNGTVDLQPVTDADLQGSNPQAESVVLLDDQDIARAQAHFQEGIITHQDIPWLHDW